MSFQNRKSCLLRLKLPVRGRQPGGHINVNGFGWASGTCRWYIWIYSVTEEFKTRF